MIRSDRARYFRDEPVQQEYRDIVDRMDGRGGPDVALPKVSTPGPFDVALAKYRNQNAGINEQSVEENSDAMPSKSEFVKVAQYGPLTGMNMPNKAASFKTDGINRVEQKQTSAKVRKLPLSFELKIS